MVEREGRLRTNGWGPSGDVIRSAASGTALGRLTRAYFTVEFSLLKRSSTADSVKYLKHRFTCLGNVIAK